MFNFWIYILLLSFIQGMTEFLPVSSSAHLLILPYVFNMKDQGIIFDIALHIGSFFAVLCFYSKDIKDIIKSVFSKKADKSLFIKIVIATLPAVLFGLFLSVSNISLRNPLIVVFTSIIFGFFLYIADVVGKKKKEFKDISFKQAFVVGLAQSLAIIPGISRSGVTTTSLLFLNYKREDALKFSFLISLPIIFLSGLWAGIKFINEPYDIDLSVLFFGIIFSFLFSIIAIKFMIAWVKRASFKVFAIYRLILGVVLYFFLK